jgi:hypothetical protein
MLGPIHPRLLQQGSGAGQPAAAHGPVAKHVPVIEATVRAARRPCSGAPAGSPHTPARSGRRRRPARGPGTAPHPGPPGPAPTRPRPERTRTPDGQPRRRRLAGPPGLAGSGPSSPTDDTAGAGRVPGVVVSGLATPAQSGPHGPGPGRLGKPSSSHVAGEALADLDYPSPGGAGGTDAPAMALALQCCRRRSDSPNHPVRVMTAHRSDAMLATGAQVL